MTERTYAGRTAGEWQRIYREAAQHFTAEIALQEALMRIEELGARVAAEREVRRQFERDYGRLKAVAEAALLLLPLLRLWSAKDCENLGVLNEPCLWCTARMLLNRMEDTLRVAGYLEENP